MASRNSDCLIGFNKYAEIASSRQRSASPRWPGEVSIMIVGADNSGRCLIRSIISKPSIWGMCMSVKMSAYGFPTLCASDISANASAPPSTDFETISQRLNIPSRMRRLVRLSSTTKTRTPRRISGGAMAPIPITFPLLPIRVVKWNCVPLATSLSIQIRPPHHRHQS
jgi:hypothetical protein